jgi:hypothetical protein
MRPAEIQINGKKVHLGKFGSDGEAARKFDKATGRLRRPVDVSAPGR